MNSHIPGVVFGQLNPRDQHSDDRRDMECYYNGDLEGFPSGQQVKLLKIKQSMLLARHSHAYPEWYTVLNEDDVTVFLLRTLDNDPMDQIVRITHGTRLMIPSRVAHLALCSVGTYLLGVTRDPYDQSADIRYDDFTDQDEELLRGVLTGSTALEEDT